VEMGGNQRAQTPGSLAQGSDRVEEEYHFDPESTVLRRADADDCDAIINLVEIGEDDIYNRVYSYPKILKLIETAYLAITVIDKATGSVVGFAAFEDFPQVSHSSGSLWSGSLARAAPSLSAPRWFSVLAEHQSGGRTRTEPSRAPTAAGPSWGQPPLTLQETSNDLFVGPTRYD
jgi:hypothetical protein